MEAAFQCRDTNILHPSLDGIAILRSGRRPSGVGVKARAASLAGKSRSAGDG